MVGTHSSQLEDSVNFIKQQNIPTNKMTRNILSLILLALAISNGKGLQVKPSLTKLPQTLFDAASLYDGGDTIYIAGGWVRTNTYSNAIYKYSIGSDIIQQVQQLPSPIEGLALAQGGSSDELLVIGGRSGRYSYNSQILSLNKSTLGLSSLNNRLPSGLSHLSAINVNDEVSLLIGGFGSGSNPPSSLKQVLSLNRTSGVSTVQANLNLASGAGVVGAVQKNEREVNILYTVPAPNNRLYLLGATYDVEAGAIVGPQAFLDIIVASITEQRAPTVVSDADNHYIVGGIGGSGNGLPAGIYRVSKDLGSVTFFAVDGLQGGSNSYYRGNTAVYVESLNRIYVIGGFSILDAQDSISYIDLNELKSSTAGIQMKVSTYTA